MRAFDVKAFDGKCNAYIEGYRYVPSGENWTREDGIVFAGEMVSPRVDPDILLACQEQYEKDLLMIQELRTALDTYERG
jgi:hypothetical protein